MGTVHSTKPRLLCLHGRGSNSCVTEMQMSVLGLSGVAECHYMDAPHEAEAFSPDVGQGRTWVIPGDQDSIRASLQAVISEVQEYGPFDGVYAFSMGAAVVELLTDLRVLKALGCESQLWSFALLCCGINTDTLQLSPALAALAPLHCSLPSLHLLGEKDPYCPQSERLARSFPAAQMIRLPYGHSVPILLPLEHPGVCKRVQEFVMAPPSLPAAHKQKGACC